MLMWYLKLAKRAYHRRARLLASAIGRFIRLAYGCEISYLAEIDDSTRFPHKALGVVIGDGVKVGPGCTILHNTTVGGRGVPGMPTLERDVLVGAGACILGEVTVGAGARIGAGAIVLDDVPPGATVVNPSARILPTD